jgi:hypothetical protein
LLEAKAMTLALTAMMTAARSGSKWTRFPCVSRVGGGAISMPVRVRGSIHSAIFRHHMGA